MRINHWTRATLLVAALAFAACGDSSDPKPKPQGTGGIDGTGGAGGEGGHGGHGGHGGTGGSGGTGATGGSGGEGGEGGDGGTGGQVAERTPNILFIVMDDVGIDQMKSMGYGGVDAPAMPTIDAIADAGLRFRNTWSMPECSPGRSTLLTGRFPLRNNVNQALGPNDLANSQLDPWEMTVAKTLATAGYESAMFGKFHLAGPEHNEAGNATPTQLGWDYFYGWTGGLPGSIDTTAGGIAPEGTYSCGFVPNEGEPGGSNTGVCHKAPGSFGASCFALIGPNGDGDSPGMQCMMEGGILVPGMTACPDEAPAGLDFDRVNAHYVSPLVVNKDGVVEEAGLVDWRGRGFRSTIEVNAAIEWIHERNEGGSDKPWMATVSFSSPHTPLQHPPRGLLRSDIKDELTADCSNPLNQRRLADALIEALDSELERLLLETGIATQDDDGNLVYDPRASDTMVVIVGDNGSFGPTVKLPFDVLRAKGTAYQTGVWVPLIVAGPLVESPDRDVEHMVNATDVFRLFAEIAEVDVEQEVSRRIDALPLLPYLVDPSQASIRTYNFTQGGLNIQANGAVNGPCLFGTMCSHTPTAKSVCEDNGGVWWGVGADDPSVLKGDLEHCWQVNQAIFEDDPPNYHTSRVSMGPTVYQAVRNEKYKLVRNWALDYDDNNDRAEGVETIEFYEINQSKNPLTLKLDRAGDDLLQRHLPPTLNEEEQENFDALKSRLEAILDSQVACPGDGNGDGVVDQADIDEYERIASDWGQSSTYDFNLDGLTDADDLEVIEDNLGPCP